MEQTPRRRVPARGPVLAATLVTVGFAGVLWLATLPSANPDQVCPAIFPAPWWCTADSVRQHGVRLTQALLLAYALVVLAATALHRRWPRAAWIPVLALPVGGWLMLDAATP